MIADTLLTLVLGYWPLVLATFLGLCLLRNKYNGLERYPGPALAAFSDWWRYHNVRGRRTEQTHIQLHRQYGDVVRLGPNALSFADPKAIKIIYGLNKHMTKSDFYPVQQAVAKGERLQSLFSTKDEDYHAKYRRCVNNAFSMSSLVGYEPLVDSTMSAFIEQTRTRYCDTGKSCQFSAWLQRFAFDVIGELTWSKRLGFVERDEDIDGIIEFVGRFFDYAAPVGQMPFLDLIFEKNPIKLKLQKWGISKKVFAVTRFALAQSATRAAEMEKIKRDGSLNEGSGKGVDLLMKFTQAQHDHPAFMTDKQVLSSCTSMIFAGSETTAISLSSIFYFLIKHSRVYDKLMAELDEAAHNGSIAERDNGRVSWSESLKLPYLDAVINESFRLHPAPGLVIERVVPPQGMDVLGNRIPGGTIVGCNAWVVHRRPEVFGNDPDTFRPERWLEAKPDQLREMKASMLQFGAGARTCIGKNISLLEIYKLVPTFLRNFEVDMADPDSEWKTHNAWFVRQLNFVTRFKPRQVMPFK
ncbi:cytochrome P450-like protein [Dothistroma septosporum NZE10]|uniref:Cytochrome P450-like protein n=1 Tax=Dothistroma septosporum (strain NZE10 / CBS 128990) TaxID=675120 RepID=N1PZT6_DOTSN|nr:cytochrome P450-like protein [Dothistroma septosporum NZE10]